MRLKKRNPERAAPGLRDCRADVQCDSLPTACWLRTQADIEHLGKTLDVIADWRDDWCARADRAQLWLEVIGLSEERHDELMCEGKALGGVMAHIATSIGGES